ncbi:hypothetical protein PVK06_034671 [Gossypium arboreum]|uniref:Uncharacterized protein n=1 Tax=Gossypium arboreum TaxID=29729 RepID=A0ABR0NFW9_GOSAR|nr:hypothetical protein PVK06_034671 [Gossypium arboreum]
MAWNKGVRRLLIKCDCKITIDLILKLKKVGSPKLSLEIRNWMERNWKKLWNERKK